MCREPTLWGLLGGHYPIKQGPTLVTSLNLNYFPKGTLSPRTVILRVRASTWWGGVGFQGWGTKHSSLNNSRKYLGDKMSTKSWWWSWCGKQRRSGGLGWLRFLTEDTGKAHLGEWRFSWDSSKLEAPGKHPRGVGSTDVRRGISIWGDLKPQFGSNHLEKHGVKRGS